MNVSEVFNPERPKCECGRSAIGLHNGKHYCEACTDWKAHRTAYVAYRRDLEARAVSGLSDEDLLILIKIRGNGWRPLSSAIEYKGL